MTARSLVLSTWLSIALATISLRVRPSSAFGPNVCGRNGSLGHICCHNKAGALRHRVPVELTKQQRQPRPNNAPRATQDGDEGGERRSGDGIGLDGKWEVETGEGASGATSGGESADSVVPGQLPESPGEGQDWAGWAREWRDDPKGKAERLVKRWESEEEARKAAQGNQNDEKKTRGPRATKNVPVGLSVTETGSSEDDEGVVDWSKGQQLLETDRELNFAAEWQGHADRVNRLHPSERERLEATMRQALSKTKTKKNKSNSNKKKGGKKNHRGHVAVSEGSTKGFGSGVTHGKVAGGSGEGVQAIHQQEGGVAEGKGDGTVRTQVATSTSE